jgi:NAD(P)-dependent dehydrogenase (short-subunit alcohol dehydrogenase family)
MSSSLFSLEGKNVAVVGAGSGIGQADAVGCAAHGGRVVCLDINAKLAQETAETILGNGGQAEAAGVDLCDGSSVETAFTAIRENHGSLDVLVCTPAVNVRKALLDYTDEEFDLVIGLNLKGGLHAMQSAGRIMSEQGSGSIIMFSSIRSLLVEPGQGVYAATKAGILQMARALASELGPKGVRVNAVAPGVVETPLTGPIKDDPDWYQAYADRNILRRWAQPEEMVGATVFLASEAASYMTGAVIYVDGGWTATDGRFTPPGM